MIKTKLEWQIYYGFTDNEMTDLTDLITIFTGKVTSINPTTIKNKIANISTGLIKGVGYKTDKKIGNYKFNK